MKFIDLTIYKEILMTTEVSINLGDKAGLTILYAYPNNSEINETLAETLAYWLKQTIRRDGFEKQGVTLVVNKDDSNNFTMVLSGDESLKFQLERYQEIHDEFSHLGLNFYKNSLLSIMDDELWDPNKKDWRFLLPLGMPLMNMKAIQFFHFPTLRLLCNERDALNDPVPKRVEDFLELNGVDAEDTEQYMMMANSIPVAGPDDEGALVDDLVDKFRADFEQYDTDLINMLLKTAQNDSQQTLPIITWGKTTMEMFNNVFKTSLSYPNSVDTATIFEEKDTPVLSMAHPFSFFYKVQKEPEADSGITYPGTGVYQLTNDSSYGFNQAIEQNRRDIIGACWIETITAKPMSAKEAYSIAEKTWTDESKLTEIKKWLLYHGSMWVENGTTGRWEFKIPKEVLFGTDSFFNFGIDNFISNEAEYSTEQN